jgi:hypothetical protein
MRVAATLLLATVPMVVHLLSYNLNRQSGQNLLASPIYRSKDDIQAL